MCDISGFDTYRLAPKLLLIIIWQGKSERSDWFFLGQDFAIRTVSVETVISCVFLFRPRRTWSVLPQPRANITQYSPRAWLTRG